MENAASKYNSFLRASCSSIIARSGLESNKKAFLSNSLIFSEDDLEEDQENDTIKNLSQDDYLKVYLRMKNVPYDKALYHFQNQDTLIVPTPNVKRLSKTFKFSKIFESESMQSEIFDEVVKPKILNFMNGLNCSLLSYGASGSGKTFTIIGTADEPGIIPRTLEFLFSSLPQLSEKPSIKPSTSGGVLMLNIMQSTFEKNVTRRVLDNFTSMMDVYNVMAKRLSTDERATISINIADVSLSMWITFVEIYNENIYDLLNIHSKTIRDKLQLGHTKEGLAFIKDVTYVNVSSAIEAYKVLQYGIANLQRASTDVNENSSRSHSLFSIKLLQHSKSTNCFTLNSFNFCDLAGSERLTKTKNVDDRLKESKSINTSLLVLGRCINLIRENQKLNKNTLIPFRESKLTQIFQNALSGQEIISMIVNVNPISTMLNESLHTLNFSAIAKDVVLQQQDVELHQCENRFIEYINASVLNTSQDEELDRLSMLQQEEEELDKAIENQKLEAQTERDRLITSYKALIAETEKFWKERYANLKQQLDNKRKQQEVIAINSSSDDDVVLINSSSDEDAEDPTCNEQKLRKQVETVTAKIESIDKKLQESKSKNCTYMQTLKNATDEYHKLHSKYKKTVTQLCQQIVNQSDIISNLKL